MTTEPKMHGWLWIALIVAALAAYVGGYIYGSDRSDSLPRFRGRRFCSVAVARLYPPLTWLEAKLTKNEVHLWVNEPPYGADDYSYLAKP